jgi:hypothetical protein
MFIFTLAFISFGFIWFQPPPSDNPTINLMATIFNVLSGIVIVPITQWIKGRLTASWPSTDFGAWIPIITSVIGIGFALGLSALFHLDVFSGGDVWLQVVAGLGLNQTASQVVFELLKVLKPKAPTV